MSKSIFNIEDAPLAEPGPSNILTEVMCIDNLRILKLDLLNLGN